MILYTAALSLWLPTSFQALHARPYGFNKRTNETIPKADTAREYCRSPLDFEPSCVPLDWWWTCYTSMGWSWSDWPILQHIIILSAHRPHAKGVFCFLVRVRKLPLGCHVPTANEFGFRIGLLPRGSSCHPIFRWFDQSSALVHPGFLSLNTVQISITGYRRLSTLNNTCYLYACTRLVDQLSSIKHATVETTLVSCV
jgi:hypothetical protein